MDGPSSINWTQVLMVLISASVPAFVALRSMRLNHQLTSKRDTQAHNRQKELQQYTAEELAQTRTPLH